jgi:surface protein
MYYDTTHFLFFFYNSVGPNPNMKFAQTTLTLLLLQEAMANKAGKVRSKESKGKKGKGKSGKGKGTTAAPTRASTDGPTAASTSASTNRPIAAFTRAPTDGPTAAPSRAGPTAAPSRALCTSANSFNSTSLRSAVRDYFDQGCLTDITCGIILQYGDIGGWKTCEVIDMLGLFNADFNPQAVNFNKDLNNWDVSKVTLMQAMFAGAAAFNQPLKDWDVSKVTAMNSMFITASSFNQPLKDWDVSKVTAMQGMFQSAKAFNQPIRDWDVSKVTDMSYMFYDAQAFNQNLCAWGKVASFPYSAVTEMFGGSGCTYQADPTQATKGPFCTDDSCTAVFV